MIRIFAHSDDVLREGIFYHLDAKPLILFQIGQQGFSREMDQRLKKLKIFSPINPCCGGNNDC